MRVTALKCFAPQRAMASPHLCDDYLTAPHFPPRGPLEPWCESLSDHLQEAIADRHAHIDDLADSFEQAVEIALLLGRLGEAKKLCHAAIAYFVSEAEDGAGVFATMPALWMLLGLARVERAVGHYDAALFAFERIAALERLGSLDDGPLIISAARFAEIESSFPESSARLRFVARAEALETLVHARRFDVAIAAARARCPDEPRWLGALRFETIATSLGRMGLLREVDVYLASVMARHSEHPRLPFEQKRAEALAAEGRFDDAALRVAFIAQAIEKQWEMASPVLSDVVLAARASRLSVLLGRTTEGALLASRARVHAAILGDVPLEAELALRVVESDTPSDIRADAADALARIALATGYAIMLPHRGMQCFEPAMPAANEPRAPTYPRLRDRLYAIAA